MARKSLTDQNLIGLVLAGGQSKRMGEDKSRLQIHARDQWQYCYDLLNRFVDRVYLSCREDQSFDCPGDIKIMDLRTYRESGPMGGILSAMETVPEKACLVLAVDLPLVNESVIETLLDHRDPLQSATAFYNNSEEALPEPLCAVYEPKAFIQLKTFFELGGRCPRKFLRQHPCQLVEPPFPEALFNMNEPRDLKILEKMLTFQNHDSA